MYFFSTITVYCNIYEMAQKCFYLMTSFRYAYVGEYIVENQKFSSKSIGRSSWLPALPMCMCQYPSSFGRHMLVLAVLCIDVHDCVGSVPLVAV